MDTFNILAQSLPNPDCNIIILANTGRSGSTLLAQMFESVPGRFQICYKLQFTLINRNKSFVRTPYSA